MSHDMELLVGQLLEAFCLFVSQYEEIKLDQLALDSPTKRKEVFMKKKYAKSLPEYDEIEFDEEAVLNSRKIGRKMPTSISLSPEVVEELKHIADKKGIPYQVLMRSFIMEGLQRLKDKKSTRLTF